MIASLMIYGLLVAALIGLAASSIEHGFGALHWPRRLVWMVALIASLALPVFMVSVNPPSPAQKSQLAPQHQGVETGTEPANSAETQTPRDRPLLSSVSLAQAEHIDWVARSDLDTLLKSVWVAMSLGALALYVVGWIRLRHAARHWSHGDIDGVTVFIADQVGPAVIGCLTPRIVIPSWLLATPLSTRSMVMAHERSHITARDPLLTHSALLLAAIAPWNLPVLWQLRRLRFAIEIDCDARVLRKNADAAAYGEMLLAVGQHRTQMPIGAIGMTEPVSQLERRIRIMMSGVYRHARLLIIASFALAASLVVAAAQLDAPMLNTPLTVAQNASPSRNDQTGIDKDSPAKAELLAEQRRPRAVMPLDPKAFDKYVGYYEMESGAIFTITRDGNHFFSQLTGQPNFEVYPESATKFFYTVVAAQLSFVANAQGQVTELVLHQNGYEQPAKRITEADAKNFESAKEARIANKTPSPGTEGSLRRFIDSMQKGQPNYDEMTPLLAAALREQVSRTGPMMKSLGALKSLTFKSVNPQGMDVYEATFESGSAEFVIAPLTSDGKVVARAWHVLP